MLALVSDEDPDCMTLLKNPRRFLGSLVYPMPLDGLLYGFSGPDAQRLVAVCIPPSTFEVTSRHSMMFI